MGANFFMVCEETKYVIWIGQGWAATGMECFYSGDEKVMEDFQKFLQEHEDKNLTLRHEDHVYSKAEYYINYQTKKPYSEGH